MDLGDGQIPLASGASLAYLNDDYRAWLTIDDSSIDYPIMQGKDDLYYASHDAFGESSITGAIYLAAANSADFSDNYNIIYGHHMDNKAMFGALDNYRDKTFFDAHRKGVIALGSGSFDLTVFAAIETDAYESLIYTIGERSLAEIFEYIEEHAIQLDLDAARGASRIVGLSTCAGITGTDRLVVFAAMSERTPIAEETSENKAEESPVSEEQINTEETNTELTNTEFASNETEEIEIIDNETPLASGLSQTEAEPNPSADADEIMTIEDDPVPLAMFIPEGNRFGENAWALINLICLIFTIYLLLPLLNLSDKYGRVKLMKKYNATRKEREEEIKEEDVNLFYQVKKFRRRFSLGLLIEVIITVIAIVAFVLTENMSLPMILIDKWTPVMLALLAGCWGADVALIRYRNDRPAEA